MWCHQLVIGIGLVSLFTWAIGGTAWAAEASADGQSPPAAELIRVAGSSLQGVTASSDAFSATITPEFSPEIANYVLNCPSGTTSVSFTMTAARGRITVDGKTGRAETATVSLTTNQAVVIKAPSRSGSTPTEYWIRCLPPNFPPLEVTADTPHAPNGYYLADTTTIAPAESTSSLVSAPYVFILDNHGTPIWWQQTPFPPAYFNLWQRDVLIWDAAPSGGAPNFVNSDGYTTDDLRTGATTNLTPADAPADGHAIIHLRDGNIVFLTTPMRTGVDLSAIGDGSDQNVADCVIQEDDPSGKVVWSWDSLDHVGLNESIYPISEKTRAGQQFWDIFHCNSVSLDQNDLNQETADVVLSLREESSVYLIDRATGNVIWKVGGTRPTADDPDASARYLTIRNDPETTFYAQHDANLSASGALTLFDDHSGPPLYFDPNEVPGPARGVTYQINAARGTATFESAIVAPDDENSIATGSFEVFGRQWYGRGGDEIVGWGISNPLTSNGTTASPMLSDVGPSGVVNLAVDFVEPTGAAFPGLNASYRVTKVFPWELPVSLLHDSMGGLPKRR